MAFAWKFLFPLSLINLFAVAIEVYFLRNDTGPILSRGDLGVMIGVNLPLTVAAISLFGNAIKEKVRPPVRTAEVVTSGARLAPGALGSQRHVLERSEKEAG